MWKQLNEFHSCWKLYFIHQMCLIVCSWIINFNECLKWMSFNPITNPNSFITLFNCGLMNINSDECLKWMSFNPIKNPNSFIKNVCMCNDKWIINSNECWNALVSLPLKNLIHSLNMFPCATINELPTLIIVEMH
jgi:hypothetical protein